MKPCYLGLPLLAALGWGCSPALETLNPVTLQASPREPSQVPVTEPPEPMTFDEEETDEDGEVQGTDRERIPPKRHVIDKGGSEGPEQLSLAEVARRERERREGAAPPVASIDNKNIARHAAAAPPPMVTTDRVEAPPASDSGGEEAAQAEVARAEAERYWRDRVGSLRMQWHDLVLKEARIEREVNGLRRDFYQEDDGYYRDAEIKPKWDRAWELLQQTRQEILDTIDELDLTLEEGRRAGALPGWLREGIELEPERPSEEDRRRLGVAEPVEPAEAAEAVEIDS